MAWLGWQPEVVERTRVLCIDCKHDEFIGVSTGYSVTLEGGVPVLQATRMQLQCSHCHTSFVCRVDGAAAFALEKCESGGMSGPSAVGRLSGEAEDKVQEVIDNLPRNSEEMMEQLRKNGEIDTPDAAGVVAAMRDDPRVDLGS